jgi:hypothetical protein
MGKRFGAQYADAVNGVIIGGVIMQTVFHHPRYFYKGTGSFRLRAGLRLFHDVLFGIGGSAANNLFEEFLSRKITTHVPKAAMALSKPILREGTPVSLISVEELGSKTAEGAGPIDFVLANDIQVGGGDSGEGWLQSLGPSELRQWTASQSG